MKKVAIYARVSTLNQAKEGYSIDGQINALTKYCEAMDWKIVDTYTDAGYSGSSIDRPAMKRMLLDIENKRLDAVIVYKLDRLSRNVQDTLDLIKNVFNENSIDFISLSENIDTSSAMGGLFLTLLSAIAEFEREQITERMHMGKVGRARSGKPMGWTRPPFGYTYADGNYIVDDFKALIIKKIYKEYLSGTSITKLRDKLNEEGHIGKDIKWSYRAVRLILDNPVYAGYINFKEEVYKGNHKPIVSKETFDKVQLELDIRQKQAYANNNNPRPFQGKYMLSGLARCGYCGAPLESTLGNIRKDGTRLKKYQCMNRTVKLRTTNYNNNKKCVSGFYHMNVLEEYVVDEISKLQMNPKTAFEQTETKSEDHTEIYEQRIISIDKKINKLSDLYMNDLISLEDMQLKAKSLKDERSNLIDKIYRSENNLKNIKKEKAQTYLDNLEKNINEETYENKKKIINILIEKVYVKADEIKVNWKF
ncbi:recombinase family protein [Carnobacterium mobile]|uniref:recombinase family protein n=1 Tax=Carnobacterium mobile TaxID=2750 RepID=UPI0005597777|nr:recombinase family protein [Carnobacterium mobile]